MHRVLAAINPRTASHGASYRSVAEWNWAVLRTRFFAPLAADPRLGGAGHPDIGHWRSAAVARHPGKRQHLWGPRRSLVAGKAATVVGDAQVRSSSRLQGGS